MTITFTRPGYLATITNASPVGQMMLRMESAFVSGDVARVENGYHAFMINMGSIGTKGVAEDNDIAE